MTVKIELSDEQGAVLKARAAAQGLTLEDWFQRLAGIETPPVKGRYSLSELVEQCDLSAPLSAEDQTWIDTPAIGREAL